MNCPDCGTKSRVLNSRTVDSKSDDGRNEKLLRWADEVIGWYTQDWVVRQRRCPDCGWSSMSIEIIEGDLQEMKNIWKTEEPQGGDNG